MSRAYDKLIGRFSMFTESVSMSIANIYQNRMRSFLTILGIMIGVTAVIALITTISGVSSSIADQFSSLGAGTLTLSVTGNELKPGLTAGDMDAIVDKIEHVSGVTPSVTLRAVIARGSKYEENISVAGRNDFYFINNSKTIERGRAVNIIDINDMSRVCLISSDMVDAFFYGVDPIGETLYVSGLAFHVVGILSDAESGTIAGMISGSNDLVIPYTTALKMNGTTYVKSLTVYVDSSEFSSAVSDELEDVLDAMFNYEDDMYSITSMRSIEDVMNTMLSMMSALLAGIASISLLVGGIGIMNMMLTSVTERTLEIGLKKAIGARPGQIQSQFLIESFLLSMVGGVAGVMLGISLSAVLSNLIGTAFVISSWAIFLGVGFSAAVGIIFGWSPARKASKLNPIDALRRL